jgi:integration host factor subunit beta
VAKNKSDLIADVAGKAGIQAGRAEHLINLVFASMTEALARGDGIEIGGFGRFSVRRYGSYEGRNPRSGNAVHVQPKRLPFFKVGKELHERVNSSRSR